MKQPNGKIIARSVGYRVGKRSRAGEVLSDDELYAMFQRIFADDLVHEAVRGYQQGRLFAATRRQEQQELVRCLIAIEERRRA